MLTALVVALACSTPAWTLQTLDDAPRGGDAQVRVDVRVRCDAPAYPTGSPAFVNLEVVNIAANQFSLQMSYLGLPLGLELWLVDPDGRRSSAQIMNRDTGPNAPTFGPPMPHHPSQFYTMKSGERVSLRYDMTRLFDLKQPGTYHLEIVQVGGPTIRRIDFEVVTLELRHKMEIDGLCGPPLGYLEKFDDGGGPIHCRLEIGQARDRQGGPWFATTSGVTTPGPGVPRVATPLVVPPETRIGAHAIDYRGCLWAVLVAKDESSLVIWDLKLGRSRSAIPWGKHVIEMGSTPTNTVSNAKVVIAGVPGQPKLSTLTDAQADGR